MSERQRHRRKDDTWTSNELTSALQGSKESSRNKEKSRKSGGSGVSDERRDRKSARHHSDQVDDDHKRSAGERERKSHDERRDSKRDRESEKKRRDEREDIDKRERDKRREKEKRRDRDERERRDEKRRDRDERERRDEKRRGGDEMERGEERRRGSRSNKREKENDTSSRKRNEDGTRRDREKSHRDEDERRIRNVDSSGSDLRERERRRDERKKEHRSNKEDEDKESRRRERREEKARRAEEGQLDERERRHRERERRHQEKKDQRERHESSLTEKESRHRRGNMESNATESTSATLTKKDDYNYEDEEFEDYEDDFDDDNEDGAASDVDAVIRAIQKDNERVASARSISATSEHFLSSTATDTRSETPIISTNLNFSSRKLRSVAQSKISKKVLKRRDDLLTLIQLDVISFDIFELPPITEYNFYIKNFGNQNTRQVSTQCNDDALEIETQTDQSETTEKWTQQPQDGAFACGGVNNEQDDESTNNLMAVMRDGSQRFSNFMTYASGIAESSFLEETVWRGNKPDHQSVLSCCDSCSRFNTNLSYLHGRHILHTTFGDGLMAVSFGISKETLSTRIDQKGIITIWKASNTNQPDKILVCDALPTRCCFIPKNKKLLFAGTDDGSVLVYDLSESSSMHKCIEIKKNTIVVRYPTYSTANLNDVHSSPIISLNPVGGFQNLNQVFSLEESSKICVWIVVDVISDMDDDVSLVPHGRVKLVKSLSLNVASKSSSPELGIRPTCASCPDSNVFYVGDEKGQVTSWSRDRKLKTYRSHGVGCVTSLSISKLNTSLMLTSYADGTLALFSTKQEYPVMTWSLGDSSVLFCDWSNCRSSVFFALDSTNQFHVWDLMATDSAPVVSNSFEEKTLRLCVDNYSSKSTSLMVAYESSKFELHRISPHFTDSVTSDEAEEMMSLVMSFG